MAMDQEQLRQLGDNEAVKNELVKEFTQHLLEPTFPDDTVVKVKMVVLGPMSSGKTSWVTRVTLDKFNASEPPTIGAKYSSQGVAIDDTEYQFEIWDVSGEEWCRALCPMYLQHAHAAVICYDPTEADSFQEAKEWVEYTKKQGDRDLLIAMVGTKHDLTAFGEFPVNTEDVFNFFVNDQQLEQQFLFPDVSNKSGDNVQDVILTLAEAFHERGVKVARESVLRDADKAFETLVDKGVENQETLTRNNTNLPGNDAKVEKCKSRAEKISVSFKTGASKFWKKSKVKAKAGYKTTIAKSSAVAGKVGRGSKRFGSKVQEHSRRLIRKIKGAPMEEVETVPAASESPAKNMVRNSEQVPLAEYDEKPEV